MIKLLTKDELKLGAMYTLGGKLWYYQLVGDEVMRCYPMVQLGKGIPVVDVNTEDFVQRNFSLAVPEEMT